jgi:hypothetical protein
LLLGEPVAVTLAVQSACPVEEIPLHIVFVMDGSGTMAGEPGVRIQQTARDTIDLMMSKATTALVQAGVVEFNASARTLCELTSSADQAKGCLGQVGAAGPSCVDCGIREGLKLLIAGRRSGAMPINEVMVVLSDSLNAAGCPPVITAARQAKAQGVIVMTACASNACDVQCLREAASSPRYAFAIDQHQNLLAAFGRIARDSFTHALALRWAITETLPANMALVPGSANPPAVISPAGDRLVWTLSSRAPVTVTYRLRPAAPGVHPTSLGARATMWDSRDRAVTTEFPLPLVSVLEPFPPTATATATQAPETPTTQPTRWSVYLPKAERASLRGNAR